MSAHRIFFDTEFIEDGKTIDLISIGLVRDDGATYYAESCEAELYRASDWVRENVIVHLTGVTKSRAEIAADIIEFAGESPEFWAYYADYDWVALCQLYGTMMDLPKGWPMFCRDIKQLCASVGNPKLPEQSTTEHHALADAQWAAEAFAALSAPAPGTPAREFDHTTIDFVLRYGGRCRECADHLGTCPNGLPCDVDDAKTAIRWVLKALNYGIANGFVASPALPSSPVGEMDARADRFLAWACETFTSAVATNVGERLMRFTEEAVELAMACSMPRATLDKIMERVYGREPGNIKLETAQCQVTLELLAKVLRIDLDAAADEEFQRVQSIPKEHWGRRHAAKVAIGIATGAAASPQGGR